MRVVIGGAGELGCHIASKLAGTADVVIIDSDKRQVTRSEENLDVLALQGDLRHRSTLRRAEVDACDVFFAVTRDDAANVLAASFAKEMGAQRTIARVEDPEFFSSAGGIERSVLGADALVCGSRLLGSELVRRISEIEAKRVLAFGGGEIHAATISIGDLSPFVDKRLTGAKGGRGQTIIAAVQEGRLIAAPSVDRVASGDMVLSIGEPEHVAASVWSLKGGRPGRAYVVGGGLSGLQLARSLAAQGWEVRLIEQDRRACEHLAANLPGVTIVNGDGTQLSFLQTERVGLAQVFVAATRSDEVNLMASLLARQQGVPCSLTVAHRPGYSAVYDALGLDGTSSVHDVVTTSMRWLLPAESIVRREPFADGLFEIAELEVSAATNARAQLVLQDLPIPALAVLAGVLRGGHLLADPRLPLMPDDHIIVCGRHHEIDELAKSIRTLGRRR